MTKRLEIKKKYNTIFNKAYKQEAGWQREDTNFYKKLTTNPILEYSSKINTAIDNFKKENLITEKLKIHWNKKIQKHQSFTHHLKFISKEILRDLLLTQSILTQVIYLSFQTISYNYMQKPLKILQILLKKYTYKKHRSHKGYKISIYGCDLPIFLPMKV